MVTIELNNIDSLIPIEVMKEICNLANRFIPDKISDPVYIELWKEEDFRMYFKFGRTWLKQPIGEDKMCEGFHDFRELNGILTHQIAIIVNDNWKITLKHEIFHVICSDMIGVSDWNQIADLYRDYRRVDPFEITAILASNPSLISNIEPIKRLTILKTMGNVLLKYLREQKDLPNLLITLIDELKYTFEGDSK